MNVNKKLLTLVFVSVIVLGIGATLAIAYTNTEGDSSFYKNYHKSKFMGMLTEEQMSILMETKMELKEQGATHEEMRGAMKELYTEWGIEFPEWDGDKTKLGFGGRHKWGDKTKLGFGDVAYSGEGCKYNKDII